jgi:hypothetical protein
MICKSLLLYRKMCHTCKYFGPLVYKFYAFFAPNDCIKEVHFICPLVLFPKRIQLFMYEGESESKDNFETTTLVPLMENKCTYYFST